MSLRFVFMAFFTPTAMFMGVARPFVGLLMLVFLYYFRPEVWGAPDWFRPIQFITLSVTAGWFMSVRTFKMPTIMVAAALTILAIVGSAFSPAANREAALAGASVLAKIVLVMFLTVQLVDSPKRINQLLWINVVGMIWNLKTILVSSMESLERVNVGVGQGGGANYLAMVLVMQLPFLAMKTQYARGRERIFAFILAPVYVLCLVKTGSRSGLLALAVVVALIILRSRQRLVGVALSTILVGIVLIFLPPAQWARLKQGLGIGDVQRDGAAEARIALWGAGLKMFRENPIVGKGYSNFQRLSPRYAGIAAGRSAQAYRMGKKGQRGFVAHSTWLQTLAEGGLMTALPFFGMFLIGLFALQRTLKLNLPPPYRRQFKVYVTSIQGMMLAYMVCGTFGSYIHMDFLWWYLGLAGATPLVARRVLVWHAQQRDKGAVDPGVFPTSESVTPANRRLSRRPQASST